MVRFRDLVGSAYVPVSKNVAVKGVFAVVMICAKNHFKTVEVYGGDCCSMVLWG